MLYNHTHLMVKPKYYVVWKGRKTGIFSTWAECSAQVNGFVDAEYKAFESLAEAQAAFAGRYADHKGRHVSNLSPQELERIGQPVRDSFSVDAACSGNPGLLEYRAVHTATRRFLFRQGPFQNGTNNIGEFLAIVQALALLKKKELPQPVYSDSQVALGWVQAKRCKTRQPRLLIGAELLDLIARAETWLGENSFSTPLLKWHSQAWGEIPADYGRK